MSVHVASLGCAKNLIDSERLLGRLASRGALVGAAADDADILIVNTCGFIAPARLESINTIREYEDLKRRDPKKRLFVMGCLVERDRAALKTLLPEVDRFFGIDEHQAVAAAIGLAAQADEDARLLLTPSHTAYLRISEGCDNRCTYCTIPSIRGPFRSVPFDRILEEAEQLAELGVRELNLIGQDTSSYGSDLHPRRGVHHLLQRLQELDGIQWIRLLYLHPAHVTEELIDAYETLSKVTPYADLPLQHLNDDILRRMGRKVTKAQCLELVHRFRERVPGISLRTTLIVGFPGETQRQFEELLLAVEELRFDHLGAFAYSREEGTPAAAFADPIPTGTVEARLERLMDAQREIVHRKNEDRIGEEALVLVDAHGLDEHAWIGRTAGQAPDVDPITHVLGGDLHVGQFVRTTVVAYDDYDLIARPTGTAVS